MVDDEFALNKFKHTYGHMIVDATMHRGPGGGSEILVTYNKPRFRRDWIPGQFCRRPVRLVRLNDDQAATETPQAGAAS